MTAKKAQPKSSGNKRSPRAPPPAHSNPWVTLIKNEPYGDLYRLWSINPAVIQLAISAARRMTHFVSHGAEPHVLPMDDILPIDLGLAVQRQQVTDKLPATDSKKLIAALTNWYKTLADAATQLSQEKKPLNGLVVLDLGCGLGYLAGLLVPLGADYYGVDKDEKLIAYATSLYPSAKFLALDLDQADNILAPALRAFTGEKTVHFVTSVNLIEHLARPQALLSALAEILAPNHRQAVAFFTTSNIRYYCRFSTEAKSDHFQLPEKNSSGKYNVHIVCLQKISPGFQSAINLHQRPELASHFRDAGFLIVQETPLFLPPGADLITQGLYAAQETPVNWGLPPFRAFVFTPLPPRSPPTSAETEAVKKALSKATQPRVQNKHSAQALIDKIAKSGHTVKLTRYDRLLARHNEGGCLFIVIQGSLFSPDEPEINFSKGDVFGELEAYYGQRRSTGAGAQPGFGIYVNDLVAGDDDTVVFVVAEHFARQLLDPSGGFVYRLFADLRKKLLLRNLRLTARGDGDKKFSDKESALNWYLSRDDATDGKWNSLSLGPSAFEGELQKLKSHFFLENAKLTFNVGKISKEQLGRLCGTLLHLAEIERCEFGRCQWSNCVFADPETLARIMRDTANRDQVSTMIRLLRALSIVDAFPVEKMKWVEPDESDTLASKIIDCVFSAVVRQDEVSVAQHTALRQFFANKLRAFYTSIRRERRGPALDKSEPFKVVEKSITELTALLRSNRLLDAYQDVSSLCPAAKTTIGTLIRLTEIVHSKTPYFIVLHDIPMLRAIALDPDEMLERKLFARVLAHYPTGLSGTPSTSAPGTQSPFSLDDMKEFEAHLEKNGQIGRLKLYAAALCEFVKTDISKHSGGFEFSTHDTACVPTDFDTLLSVAATQRMKRSDAN